MNVNDYIDSRDFNLGKKERYKKVIAQQLAGKLTDYTGSFRTMIKTG